MLTLRYAFLGTIGDERTDGRTDRESALYDLRPQVKIACTLGQKDSSMPSVQVWAAPEEI